MKKHLTKFLVLVVVISSVIVQNSYSQAPWNAKVMLHSRNGYIDTLWIGCDSIGNMGYQSGFDIIDTVLTEPGGIWGYDSLIVDGECFNLKRDIKNFITGIQKFDIQVADTTFGNYGFMFDYISIDTNEFKFDNGQFKITSVFLQCFSGYIIGIDKYSEYLYYGSDTLYPAEFSYDSINLIFEPNIYDCLPINDFQMKLILEVGFNYYTGTSVDEIKSTQIVLSPNPFTTQLQLHYTITQPGELMVYDALGRKVKSYTLAANQKTFELSMATLPAGVYLVAVESGGRVWGEKVVKE